MVKHDNPEKLRRLERCNTLIHTKLGAIFTKELDKENRKNLITIISVETSYDFSHAKIFVSIMGHGQQRVLSTLQKREPYFRHLLGQDFALRRVPQLRFVLDESLDHVDHIEHLLAKLREGSS